MKKNIDMTEKEFNNLVDELDSQGKIDKLKGRYALLVDHKIVKWDDDLENIVQEFQKRGNDVGSVSIQNHGDGNGAVFLKRTLKFANEVIDDKNDDIPIKTEIKPRGQYTLVVNHKIVKKIDDYGEISDDFLQGAQGLEEGGSVTLIKRKPSSH